jgi:hypothetical protein
MTCPAEDLLVRFIANTAEREERLKMVRHLMVCRECRELTAMIARLWRLSEDRVD